MQKFETYLHKEKDREDFEKEDDLADWQFSFEALKWWEEKAKRLQHAEI